MRVEGDGMAGSSGEDRQKYVNSGDGHSSRETDLVLWVGRGWQCRINRLGCLCRCQHGQRSTRDRVHTRLASVRERQLEIVECC
jgi:hypothetical protein